MLNLILKELGAVSVVSCFLNSAEIIDSCLNFAKMFTLFKFKVN